MTLTYGSLFSGGGMLDLAVEDVFGAECRWHCEQDPDASKILAAHWPTVPNLGDITAVDWSQVDAVDVICGGFPCQDVSTAGRGAGIKEGTRSGLWFRFADAVRALRPRVVVVENVGAFVVRGLDVVLGDLASLGFDAEWGVLPASAVGAPHRRDRVFIVAADADHAALDWQRPRTGSRLRGADAADADRQAGRLAGCAGEAVPQPGAVERSGRCDRLAHFGPYAPAITRWERILGRPAPAPTELSVRRVDDGSPGWVTGLGLSRSAELRMLGNGVVPQQAAAAIRLLLARLHAAELVSAMTAPVPSVCRLEGNDHPRCSDGAAIVRGDALRLPFGDETVDLIVTSPPYFALRSYQDGGEHYDGQIGSEPTPAAFLEALWAVTAECWRVLKPSGSLFVNLGDKYAGSGGHNNGNLKSNASSTLTGSRRKIEASADGMKVAATRRQSPDRYTQASDGIRTKSLMGLPWRYAIGCIDGQADPDGVGWILRQELIWSKPNGLPESVKDRGRRSHEQFFHLVKNGRYFADMDPIREEYNPATIQRNDYVRKAPSGLVAAGNQVNQGPLREDREGHTENPLGKLPDSVWTIPTQPLIVPAELGVDHFAAFPTEWPRRLIAAFSPPGGIVLDPFGGTGTTAMVARALGRFGVSVDLSADYLRLARWRVFESDGAAKVAARHQGREYRPPKPEVPGQMSLGVFDGAAS